MAKIQPSRERPAKPSRRTPAIPGWLPLMVAIAGLGAVLAPDPVSWPMRVLGAALLAAGSFWLGQDRQHDPADRNRISQLERELVRLGIYDRELGLRENIAAALRPQRGRPPASPAEHGADGQSHRRESGAGQLRAVPGPTEPDLDAPLPGERE